MTLSQAKSSPYLPLNIRQMGTACLSNLDMRDALYGRVGGAVACAAAFAAVGMAAGLSGSVVNSALGYESLHLADSAVAGLTGGVILGGLYGGIFGPKMPEVGRIFWDYAKIAGTSGTVTALGALIQGLDLRHASCAGLLGGSLLGAPYAFRHKIAAIAELDRAAKVKGLD